MYKTYMEDSPCEQQPCEQQPNGETGKENVPPPPPFPVAPLVRQQQEVPPEHEPPEQEPPAQESPEQPGSPERLPAEVPKTRQNTDTKKVQCEQCMRWFNPRYRSRHVCVPVAATPVTDPGPIAPAPDPDPAPIAPEPAPITAAQLAAALRAEKIQRRVERVARYSAQMFGT